MPDELLDIVTEEDIVTHRAMRSVAHAQGLWHRGVHVFLLTRDGELLIQLRSKVRAQYPSVWDGSVSEHVKAGESYREAARRGLLEELGVEGIDVQPLVKFRMNYGPNDNEISTLFKGAVDPDRVRFDPGEIAQVDYLSLDKLLELMRRGDVAFSYWFIQLLRWYTIGLSDMVILPTDS